MAEKEQFIQAFEREYPITLKVLRAFPPDKMDLKPHERSRSAKELGQTFVAEENIMRQALTGEIDFSKFQAPPTDSWQEIEAALENSCKEFLDELNKKSEEDLQSPVNFGNRQMRRLDVLWGMLMDMIHHRGQFTVYLRMAGGKVPSIYGPSADEPI